MTKTAKYTPGPWEVSDGTCVVAKAKWTERLVPIALVHDPDDHSHATPVSKANTQLISAAPEMANALQRITLLIQNVREIYGNDTADWLMRSDAYKQSVAALQKAGLL